MIQIALGLLGLAFVLWFIGPFMKESGRALRRIKELKDSKNA